MRYKKQIILTGVILLLNIAALSPAFCDFYAANIFPVWIGTMGRITGLVPFSVGEWMITVFVLWVLALAAGNIIRLIKRTDGWKARMKKHNILFLNVMLVMCLILSLNWTMVNRCSKIMETGQTFYISELESFRNALVERCNEYAKRIERDENGMILYDSKKVQEKAVEALHGISGQYPRLGGYYTKMKPMMYSGLMSQSRMQGYYFPFSMESNYNNKMYIINYPECFCHELSHVKGYMMEDEANFLSYLACVSSDDVLFQYSGYLSVLYYVDNAFFSNVERDRYLAQPAISQQVKDDNIFLTKDAMAAVEKNALIKSETVKKVSDAFNDAAIKMGGVADGMASYDRVTELLLIYYQDHAF